MTEKFTKEEVEKHNSKESCWIIVNGRVFDVTKFAALHPGGKRILYTVAGKDATKEFESFHKSQVLNKYQKLCIGELETGRKEKKEFIPYAEPSCLQNYYSPYYTESHHKFRKALKEYVDKELMPYIFEWEEKLEVPQEVRIKLYKAGALPCCVGAWPTQFFKDEKIMGGIKPEEWNMFHNLVFTDEIAKVASFGIIGNIITTLAISIPPVLHFGSKFLQDKVVRPCLTGQKMICLAITEPYGGSDVASIRTTAKKTPDGKYYLINGEKKFITMGIWSDFFVVAARTDKHALSVFLLEKEMKGIHCRRMYMQGGWASGTTYITFEDVQVPVENLIGKENEGFKYIMYNFNHERWAGIVTSVRFCRVCFEDSFRFAHTRKTFGIRLIDNQVIRQKLGNMAKSIESLSNWLENLTYQMSKMNYSEQMQHLSGDIALMKVHTTQVLEMCAREAMQIFGGLGYTRGGLAERIERIYREVRVMAIGGGSEEVMLEFGMRQAMKLAKI